MTLDLLLLLAAAVGAALAAALGLLAACGVALLVRSHPAPRRVARPRPPLVLIHGGLAPRGAR